jgi:hypothetical protein
MLRGCSPYYFRRVQGGSEDTHVGRRKERRIAGYRPAAIQPNERFELMAWWLDRVDDIRRGEQVTATKLIALRT